MLSLTAFFGTVVLALSVLDKALNRYYDLFFIVFASALFLFVVAILLVLFRGGEGLKNIVSWNLVSSFLVLYVFEVLLGLSGRVIPLTNRQYARKAGLEYDFRSKLEVVLDLRKSGEDAVPWMSPGGIYEVVLDDGRRALPLSGPANKTTVYCNEGGDYTVYKSDRHGFHNPANTRYDRGSVDVAVLGDSYVQGACVPSGSEIPAVLREKTGFRVLNLGMGGNGPLLNYAVFREYVRHVRPETVLWFFSEINDLSDLKRERANAILKKYLEDESYSQNLPVLKGRLDAKLLPLLEAELRDEQVRVADVQNVLFQNYYREYYLEKTFPVLSVLLDNVLVGSLGFPNLRRLLFALVRLVKGSQTVRYEAEFSLVRDIVGRVNREVRGFGGRFLFVYLPVRERFTEESSAASHEFLRKDEILSFLRAEGIEHIDLSELFEEVDDVNRLLPLEYAGHFNEEGYRLIALRVLRGFMSDEKR